MVVGALISVFTSRSALRSGLRMVAIGALASAVTFGIGSLIGVTLD
jgi:vacuolar iron transporter family protein